MSDAIQCPECNHRGTKVVDSRPDYERGSIRRRRECEACGARWHTLELMADRVDLLEDGIEGLRRPPDTPPSAKRATGF